MVLFLALFSCISIHELPNTLGANFRKKTTDFGERGECISNNSKLFISMYCCAKEHIESSHVLSGVTYGSMYLLCKVWLQNYCCKANKKQVHEGKLLTQVNLYTYVHKCPYAACGKTEIGMF